MIERKDADGIRILKLAHGKVSAMDIELGEAFIARDARTRPMPPVKAVIVTGTGSSFSAGVDLFRVLKDGPEYGRRFLPVLDEFLRAALTFPKPMVAAVNGHAIAGGCILAAACDHRIMAEGNGRIGIPELAVGVPFPALPLQIMAARVADGALRDLVFTGRTVLVDEAKTLGLIDEKCPAGHADGSRDRSRPQRLASIPAGAFALDEGSVLLADSRAHEASSPISTPASSTRGCSSTPTTRFARTSRRRSARNNPTARDLRSRSRITPTPSRGSTVPARVDRGCPNRSGGTVRSIDVSITMCVLPGVAGMSRNSGALRLSRRRKPARESAHTAHLRRVRIARRDDRSTPRTSAPCPLTGITASDSFVGPAAADRIAAGIRLDIVAGERYP